MSSVERGALWWEVQRRISRTPEIAERLHSYLIGVADFEAAALDALEDAVTEECPECADRPLDIAEPEGPEEPEPEGAQPEDTDLDNDADTDTAAVAAATIAMERYAAGVSAAEVLSDLLYEILGVDVMHETPVVRLRLRCEALRTQLAQQRVEQEQVTARVAKTEHILATWEADLALHTPKG
jgi:hypothetical protein